MTYKDPRSKWSQVWQGVQDVSEDYGCRVVFIGGIAVYLHAIRNGASGSSPLLEFTHDADLYISEADLGDLRDNEILDQNRRLSKFQFVRDGIDFDVYAERRAKLNIPWREILHSSRIIDGVRVASLEHLLILKLDAYSDRHASTKGRKDERDIIRIILLMCGKPHRDSIARYLTKERRGLLAEVGRGDAFASLAEGNLHKASQLRKQYVNTVEKLR